MTLSHRAICPTHVLCCRHGLLPCFDMAMFAAAWAICSQSPVCCNCRRGAAASSILWQSKLLKLSTLHASDSFTFLALLRCYVTCSPNPLPIPSHSPEHHQKLTPTPLQPQRTSPPAAQPPHPCPELSRTRRRKPSPSCGTPSQTGSSRRMPA